MSLYSAQEMYLRLISRFPPVGLVLFVSLVCTSSAQSQPIAAPDSWRSSDNGGINVLYCYLRLNGIECDYKDLLNLQKDEIGTESQTAASLTRIAASLGLPLQSVSMTMEELFQCSLPFIAHIDGQNLEEGAFVLVMAVSSNTVDIINGSNAVVQRMRLQDFRRAWSGVVIRPEIGSAAIIYFIIAFTSTVTIAAFVRKM